MATQILNIGPGSDGDGRKWPKHHYDRNDEYFLERTAAEWIKDLPGGPRPGVTYKLDRLPTGYAGFQKARADSKHVDRYVYGHPNGQFRSLVEFYPHFKHLMDAGGPAGCGCIKCAGAAKKSKEIPERRSKYFTELQSNGAQVPAENLISPMKPTGTTKKGRWSPEDFELPKRKEVDFEGTTDVYEKLIKRLKDAGPEVEVDETIEEKTSPDWRATESTLLDTLRTIRELPSYAPRIGELVMFVRKLDNNERLAWDKGTGVFRRVDTETNTWREAPKWEAGVVTQMPQEVIEENDLVTDIDREQSIIYSGFKIEPLSEPGSQAKPHTKQHKHVPLHAIRPFTLWKDCVRNLPEKDWHATVRHALTISSSLCVIDRYRFKGTWPNASVFCGGLYLGSELVLVGDTVRLLPNDRVNTVTEIMTITSIRLRFVNLDFDEDDLAPTAPALPYQTAVHITGKVYTSDPSRSFNGVSKKPVDTGSGLISPELDDFGPWYHYMDPNDTAARVEVPFSRIMGRCQDYSAASVWFTTPPGIKTEMQAPAFKAVNAPRHETVEHVPLLSRGLTAVKDSRKYGQEHDARLTTTEQLWFWADTRIEQLDLHEVNGRFVGAKDPMRTKEQLSRWQKALKGLDGKKGGLEEFEAARKKRMEQEKAALQNTGGMLGSASLQTDVESVTNGESAGGEEEDDDQEEAEIENEDDDEANAMEVDEPAAGPQNVQTGMQVAAPAQQQRVTIDLMDSEDEDEMAQNQLVGELFKNVRPGGKSRPCLHS